MRRNPAHGARSPRRKRYLLAAIAALAAGPALLSVQGVAAPQSSPDQGMRIFATSCAGCHGADAHGTDHGPALAGDRGLSRRSVAQLQRMAGLLATAGGVLFYGNPSGDFVAMDERDGKTLWHLPTNGINKASPMTLR